MSVVVTAVAPMTAEMYDAVTSRVISGDQLPDGCQAHIAGPEKLLPAIREVAGEAPPDVVPQIDQVHRVIT